MSNLWYVEKWSDCTNFSVQVSPLHQEQTPYQNLAVYHSDDYGKFFSLDGYIMITQKDEFIYHDMIVHPAMATNPQIAKVLVIGGGDGGTVRELLRYPTIKKIDMVEIDERVVRVCQEHFPEVSCGLVNDKVNLMFADGIKYVKATKELYDLIIVDSTDPIGPGEGLFTGEFYQDCFNILSDEGILVNQNESPYYAANSLEMQRAFKKIKNIFPVALAYQAHIPTYASGHWMFGFGSKKLHPVKDVDMSKWQEFGLATKYYNEKLHFGAFALPTYVIDVLNK